MIKVCNIKRYVLLFLFISVGYGSVLYVFVFLLFYWLLNKKSKNIVISNSYYIFIFKLLFFILLYYLLSCLNGQFVYSVERQLYLMFIIIILLFVAYIESGKNSLIVIIGYIIGLYLNVFYVVYYNYLINPVFGHGLLINPFDLEMINSPAYSNNLILVFCGFFVLLFKKKKIFSIISSVVIISVVIGALYLGGRAFFLISMLFLFVVLIKVFSKNKLDLFSLFIFFVLLYLVFDFLLYFIDMFVMRLYSQNYINSGRYEYWVYALQETVKHPIGGINITDKFQGVNWFHNLWFDVARVSGWIPLIILVSLNIDNISLIKKINNNNVDDYFIWLFSVISLLIMFQDVILEGNYKVFIFYMIVNSVILGRTSPTVQQTNYSLQRSVC